jgi:hypothetical protein
MPSIESSHNALLLRHLHGGGALGVNSVTASTEDLSSVLVIPSRTFGKLVRPDYTQDHLAGSPRKFGFQSSLF